MITEKLKDQLEAACDDLWWSSEADYPVEMVWLPAPQGQGDKAAEPIEINETLILQLAGYTTEESEQITVKRVELETFFEQALAPKTWHTRADKAQIAQLQHLKTILTQSLKNLQVYRCSEVEVTALVLGFVADGSLAGIKTILVET